MKSLKISLLIIGIVFGGASAAFSQTGRDSLSEEQKVKLQNNIEMYVDSLELTEEQRTEFITVYTSSVDELLLLKESDASRFSKYRKMKSIKSSRDKQMKELLTPEQFKQYSEKEEELEEKIKARREQKKG